jgi:hypothetical protein
LFDAIAIGIELKHGNHGMEVSFESHVLKAVGVQALACMSWHIRAEAMRAESCTPIALKTRRSQITSIP